MAHYLAELIHRASDETDEKKRRVAERECCELIMRLWENRDRLPAEARPLGRLEDALAAITSMQKDLDFFHRAINEGPDTGRCPWLKFAVESWPTDKRMSIVSVLTGIIEAKAGSENSWLDEHGAMLHETERRLLEVLNKWLTHIDELYAPQQRVSIEKLSPKKREELILREIESLISKQQSAFVRLKEELRARRTAGTSKRSKKA